MMLGPVMAASPRRRIWLRIETYRCRQPALYTGSRWSQARRGDLMFYGSGHRGNQHDLYHRRSGRIIAVSASAGEKWSLWMASHGRVPVWYPGQTARRQEPCRPTGRGPAVPAPAAPTAARYTRSYGADAGVSGTAGESLRGHHRSAIASAQWSPDRKPRRLPSLYI